MPILPYVIALALVSTRVGGSASNSISDPTIRKCRVS